MRVLMVADALVVGAVALVILAGGIAYRHAMKGGSVGVTGDVDDGEFEISASNGDECAEEDETEDVESELQQLVVHEDLTLIDGVGPAREEDLRNAGFHTVEAVSEATVGQLTEADGIGPRRAAALTTAAEDFLGSE